MSAIRKYVPFFVSALLMSAVLCLIYPHYQYYVDPDGTSYLTISQRYANGDYLKAINGYWSPWSCWLTAVVIKMGLAAIPASVIVNATGAGGVLYISQSFFLHFGIVRKWQWLMNITLACFLCSAVFWQSFNDLWECFFLLVSLRVMLIRGFQTKPFLWIFCGVIGALAYFAKSYSFPFFILNTVCCIYFISKENKWQWIKISFVMIGVMILCSLPWIYALHGKYGIWTTSTAGPLNMSWYLVGHPYWKDGIDLLIPPVYKDSPYYWEDPYFANGVTPHFWDSFSLLGLQLLRIGYNLWKLLISSLQISLFFPAIGIVALLSFRTGKVKSIFAGHLRIVTLSFCLFPLGYLLINFEPRYIWYMLPLTMVMGTTIVQKLSEKWQHVLIGLLPLSFLIYPAWCMAKMYDEGTNEVNIAEQLKRQNIHGSFTGMAKPGKEAQRMERLAYFSGNQFYSPAKKEALPKELLTEMRKYHVNYFFVMQHSKFTGIADDQGQPLTEVAKDSISGLIVFRIDGPSEHN